MKFKKSFFEKIFNIKRKCQGENCNHIFQEDDVYEIYDDIFCDYMLCWKCYIKFQAKSKEMHEKTKQIELNKKRKDYKILAEEIVKLINIKLTSNN